MTPWIAAAMAALAAWTPAAAAADARADEGFNLRCTQLAAPRFDVFEVPVTYVEDGSKTIDQLTVLSGNTPATHLTFGLTTVNFGYDGDIEIGVVEETLTRRVCGNLHLRVTLSMQPVTVHLAQELGVSPCARAVTREHELKHVAMFRQVLAEAARDLRSDLASAMGRQTRRAGSRDELELTTNARVKDYLSEFFRRWQRTLDERQASVDSPAEYARVKNACPVH